jgi:outer membrane protein assembly factor BamA
MRTTQLLLAACMVCLSANGQDIAPDSATKKVTIQSVRVKGSRFSAQTLTHLTGLARGQIVDEAKVREAIGNAMASGLFTNIGYDYESQPGSADVVVELTVTDQLPLLPVTIAVRGVDAEAIWKYLTDFDPSLRTRCRPRRRQSNCTFGI